MSAGCCIASEADGLGSSRCATSRWHCNRSHQLGRRSRVRGWQLRQVNLWKHFLYPARDGTALLCRHLLRDVPAHKHYELMIGALRTTCTFARSRLHALAGSSIHHSSPRLRVRLRREHVARVGVVTAGADVGVAVACVTAHVQAPSAEVSAAAQPCHVASSRQATTLQQEG